MPIYQTWRCQFQEDSDNHNNVWRKLANTDKRTSKHCTNIARFSSKQHGIIRQYVVRLRVFIAGKLVSHMAALLMYFFQLTIALFLRKHTCTTLSDAWRKWRMYKRFYGLLFNSTSAENLSDVVHTYAFRKYDIANQSVVWDDALQ